AVISVPTVKGDLLVALDMIRRLADELAGCEPLLVEVGRKLVDRARQRPRAVGEDGGGELRRARAGEQEAGDVAAIARAVGADQAGLRAEPEPRLGELSAGERYRPGAADGGEGAEHRPARREVRDEALGPSREDD